MTITIFDGNQTFVCPMEGKGDLYEVFYKFIARYYPTIHSYIIMDDGETIQCLKGRLGEGIILVKGDLEAKTQIGLFKAWEEMQAGEPITGNQIMQWAAFEYDKMEEESGIRLQHFATHAHQLAIARTPGHIETGLKKGMDFHSKYYGDKKY